MQSYIDHICFITPETEKVLSTDYVCPFLPQGHRRLPLRGNSGPTWIHNYIKYLFHCIYYKIWLSCFLICCQIPQMNFHFYLQFLASSCILFPFKAVSMDWSILYLQIFSKFPLSFHFYGFAICLDSCPKSLAISLNQKWFLSTRK